LKFVFYYFVRVSFLKDPKVFLIRSILFHCTRHTATVFVINAYGNIFADYTFIVGIHFCTGLFPLKFKKKEIKFLD